VRRSGVIVFKSNSLRYPNSMTSPCAAAWVNIATVAAGCALTASSEAASMLVTKLQQEDTKRNFRTGATTTVNIDLTYAAVQSADTFCLENTNLTAAGIVRWKLSNTALGNTDIWDSNSGNTAGTVDPNYKRALVLASSVKSGWKYARCVLTDTSLSYLEAGFLFVSTYTQFAYNFGVGHQLTVVDPSIQKKLKAGNTRVIRRPKFLRAELPFGWVTEAQRWSLVNSIDRLNGISDPVLVIFDPASANLGRDSIFGLIQESSPVVSIEGFDSAGGLMSSKSLKIDQRL
jgi:hypothetical protein